MVELAVIDVHFVIGGVCGIDQISRSPAGNGKRGIGSSRLRVVHRDDGLIGVGLRRPTADRSIERRKQENRGKVPYIKFRRSVEDDSRRRACHSSLRGGNDNLQRARDTCAVVQSRPARAVVADPPWAAWGMNQPPGIYQQWILV